MNGTGEPAPAPLAGIRVLDLSQNLAGPFATRILADLGADVIKVEPPGGDPSRAWGPPFWGEDSTLFLCANRNKRSVVLDLTSDEGRSALDALVDGADIFVQAFRAGVIERLGFGPDRLRARRPSLIYASVVAFGTEGPLRSRPGYDPLMQAASGMMSVTGEVGGSAVRSGVSVIDFATGSWLATGILAALRTRESTGEGAQVSTALFDAALSEMSYHLLGTLATGRVPGPSGTGFGAIAPYGAISCSDGGLMIAAANDRIFGRLCEALGLNELVADPRFSTNERRVAHREVLSEALGAVAARLTVDELESTLVRADVPCARIRNTAEVLASPQFEASGMVQRTPRPDIPELVDFALPITFDSARLPAHRPAPRLGEHTDEVLGTL